MEFFVYPDPFAMRYAVSFVDSFGGVGRYNPLCPEVTEIRKWCTDTFGEPNHKHSRWHDETTWGNIEFADKKDLLLFQLKWA